MKKIFLGITFLATMLIIKACVAPTDTTPKSGCACDTVKAVIDSTVSVDSSIIDTLKK